MAISAKAIMTELVERAVTQRGVGKSFPFPASDNPLRGKPVPEAYMPGRMIMQLDADTRTALQDLRSDDLATRRPIPWA